MSGEALIEQATADGVVIELSQPGKIKARGEDETIERWLPVLRDNKSAILAALRITASTLPPPARGDAVEDVLKGNAVLVVLDADATRVWLVADEEDAAKLGDVGADAVMTRDEIRVLAAIHDREVREEVLALKRELRGRLHREKPA